MYFHLKAGETQLTFITIIDVSWELGLSVKKKQKMNVVPQ